MNEITLSGLTISYLDLNSDKEQTLLFIHGNSHSKNSFRAQYQDGLFEQYRLIAMDLPGHGDSDRASGYSLNLYSDIVAGLLGVLNIKKALLVGHSLGGHIALQTTGKAKIAGLMIYGTPMLKKPIDFSIFLPNEKAAALSKESSSLEEIENLLTELEYTGPQRDVARTDFLRTDPQARTSILQSVVAGEYQDEFNLLKNFTGKSLVLVSENEKLVNNEYISLALNDLGMSLCSTTINAGHVPHSMNAEEFNARLLAFADNVFTNAADKLPLNRDNPAGVPLT